MALPWDMKECGTPCLHGRILQIPLNSWPRLTGLTDWSASGPVIRLCPGCSWRLRGATFPRLSLPEARCFPGTRKEKTCRLSISSKESVRSQQEQWMKPHYANWSAVLCPDAEVVRDYTPQIRWHA